MPITEKDALEIFGIEDLTKYETADALKADVDKTWVKLASAHTNKAVTDAVFGKINRAGRKQLEEINGAFELGLEIDDKADLLDVLKKLPETLKPRFDAIKDLEGKLAKAAPADVVAQFEAKEKELSKKLKAFEADATKWKGEFDNLNTTVQNRDKTAKIEGTWDGAGKAVPFNSTVDQLRKEGFFAMARKKYQVLLDEEGKPYAANSKGEPLMHPKKSATPWTLEEALKADAEELKLLGSNPQGGRPAQPVVKKAEQEAQVNVFGRNRERVKATPLM